MLKIGLAEGAVLQVIKPSEDFYSHPNQFEKCALSSSAHGIFGRMMWSVDRTMLSQMNEGASYIFIPPCNRRKSPFEALLDDWEWLMIIDLVQINFQLTVRGIGPKTS